MAKSEPIHVYPVPDGAASATPAVDCSSMSVDAATEGTSTDPIASPPAPAGSDQPLL
jgi:hypothetical protein